MLQVRFWCQFCQILKTLFSIAKLFPDVSYAESWSSNLVDFLVHWSFQMNSQTYPKYSQYLTKISIFCEKSWSSGPKVFEQISQVSRSTLRDTIQSKVVLEGRAPIAYRFLQHWLLNFLNYHHCSCSAACFSPFILNLQFLILVMFWSAEPLFESFLDTLVVPRHPEYKKTSIFEVIRIFNFTVNFVKITKDLFSSAELFLDVFYWESFSSDLADFVVHCLFQLNLLTSSNYSQYWPKIAILCEKS